MATMTAQALSQPQAGVKLISAITLSFNWEPTEKENWIIPPNDKPVR